MRMLVAAALALGASPALAQTTPTNPDLLSPPVGAATPGGAANPADTGASPVTNGAMQTPPTGPAAAATDPATVPRFHARDRRHRQPR